MEIKIGVIASESGFKRFQDEIKTTKTAIYNIEFVRIANMNDLRGIELNSWIQHYSIKDIQRSELSEIMIWIPTRCRPINKFGIDSAQIGKDKTGYVHYYMDEATEITEEQFKAMKDRFKKGSWKEDK